MELRIDVDRDSAKRVVLVITGSIDLASKARLLEAAHAEFSDEVTERVMDLYGVTFMDSTGIGALIELAGDAEDKGATFTIRNPSRQVERLLSVTGLLDRLLGAGEVG